MKNMNKFAQNILLFTVLFAGLVVLDQLLKLFFEKTRAFIGLGIVALHFVTNTGASFGMLQGRNILFIWISIMALGIIMMNIEKIKMNYAIPVLFIVAGIIGNLIDRVFRGFVVDFIDFKFWPVFNLADSLIVVGVIWLIIVILVKDLKAEKKENKSPKPRRR